MANILDHITDEDLRLYTGLTDAQLRRGEYLGPALAGGVFIAESQRVIGRALDAGMRPLSLFMERKWLDHERDIIARVEAIDPAVPVYVISHDQFRAITGYQVTRGALAAFARPTLPSVDAVLEGARHVVVLEGVTNYANMGAIFRSAAALGMDAVLVSPTCHDPLYRRCARVSMGAVFQVPWTRIGQAAIGPVADGGPSVESVMRDISTNTDGTTSADARAAAELVHLPATGSVDVYECPHAYDYKHAVARHAAGSMDGWATAGVPQLHAAGFTVAAMALRSDAVALDGPELASCDKLALVLGTEGEGLAQATIDACDYTACIPMDHGVDSLNVASAAAIAFWEMRRHGNSSPRPQHSYEGLR